VLIGQHACPGRFFASNEIKIALTFLLIKYEMRFPPLAPGEKPQVTEMMMETNTVSMPIKVEIRRRKEEIDLMNPLGLSA
jgi:cytochrome P450